MSRLANSLHRNDLQALALTAALLLVGAPAAAGWSFTDVTASAGISYEHGYVGGTITNPQKIACGVAAGDYDGDGLVDLYAVRGDIGPNLLYRNDGDGTFSEVGAAAGVALSGTKGSGPVFADWNGDGWLDLFVGGIEGTAPVLFRNDGDGTFSDVTAGSGLTQVVNTYSASWGDYDNNGTLDLLTTHWGVNQSLFPNHLWQHDGAGHFTPVDGSAGIDDFGALPLVLTFTGNFCDIDADGWLDITFSSDFGTSRVWRNDGTGHFDNATTAVISDENGMGAAIADYDRDGDLDWFVSSISPGPTSRRATSGNRLYQNDGNGTFTDVTDAAGVRSGHWGWGSTFADFDNDGDLDLFHVNGWFQVEYESDPARFFVSNGDGTFTESAATLGLDYPGQGRGLTCFDYDSDGDLDLFLANNSEAPVLYRNDLSNGNHWLAVKLVGPAGNSEAVGARVHATVGATTRMRELRAGCNFVSQDPAIAHFGLGAATSVDELLVEWPGGAQTTLYDVAVDQVLTIDGSTTSTPPAVGAPRPGDLVLLGAAPNPFAHFTSILFRAERDLDLRVRIFDAAGRTVRSFAPARRTAGEHAIHWDGRNARRAAVPSGVYFVEIASGATRVREKITLVR